MTDEANREALRQCENNFLLLFFIWCVTTLAAFRRLSGFTAWLHLPGTVPHCPPEITSVATLARMAKSSNFKTILTPALVCDFKLCNSHHVQKPLCYVLLWVCRYCWFWRKQSCLCTLNSYNIAATYAFNCFFFCEIHKEILPTTLPFTCHPQASIKWEAWKIW